MSEKNLHTYTHTHTHTHTHTPIPTMPGVDVSQRLGASITDKNNKLRIVTDIKVTIDYFSAFGFRYLGGGLGTFYKQKKFLTLHGFACHPFATSCVAHKNLTFFVSHYCMRTFPLNKQ